MNIWNAWVELIQGLVGTLASGVGLGLGLAIVLATVVLKSAALPVSWSIALRNCIRQKKMKVLQPQLQALKENYARQPQTYARRLKALYAKHGLSFVDGRSFAGTLLQMPLLLGMFHALKNLGSGVSFLWVPNLLKPDMAFAILAGVTTALMMVANPDMPEQMRALVILVPSIIAFVVALEFCSALSIYWAISNCFSAIQTAAAHAVVRRRIRAGSLEIG